MKPNPWSARVVALCIVLGVGIVVAPMAMRYAQAIAVLAEFQGKARWPWTMTLGSVSETDLRIDGMPAVLYQPTHEKNSPGIVLVHGMHPLGMREPRQQAFARALAKAGITVLSPHIDSLAHFSLEQESIEAIARASQDLSDRMDHQQVGVLGISFSGGLALLAAAEASLSSRIGFVITLGAHHDLSRVAAFALGKRVKGPDGAVCTTMPHPYAAGIIAYHLIDALFHPTDVAIAKEAVSALLMDNIERARELASNLSPDGHQLLDQIIRNRPSRATLELASNAIEEGTGALRELSPAGKLKHITVPVVLIHGRDDPVVPWTETRWLEHELRTSSTQVNGKPSASIEGVLISPLIRHAELREHIHTLDHLRLVHTMATILKLANNTR